MYMCLCMDGWMDVYVSVYVCTYVCMYVWMYVWMYGCMDVCDVCVVFSTLVLPLKHFAASPEMSATDRIQVILDKMREMRRCYSHLKTAVNHIERKKRRAKRKEKESLGMRGSAEALVVEGDM